MAPTIGVPTIRLFLFRMTSKGKSAESGKTVKMSPVSVCMLDLNTSPGRLTVMFDTIDSSSGSGGVGGLDVEFEPELH